MSKFAFCENTFDASQIDFCQTGKNQEKLKTKREEIWLMIRADERTLGSKTSPGLNFNCNF